MSELERSHGRSRLVIGLCIRSVHSNSAAFRGALRLTERRPTQYINRVSEREGVVTEIDNATVRVDAHIRHCSGHLYSSYD
jgi:hypothetical protein